MRFISCAGGTRIPYSLVQVMFDRSREPQAGHPGLAPCRAKIRKVRAYLIRPPDYPGLGLAAPTLRGHPASLVSRHVSPLSGIQAWGDTGLSIHSRGRDAGPEPSP